MAKKPRVLWANSINLAGLYSEVPIRCDLNREGEYWDKSGEYDVLNPSAIDGQHLTHDGELVQYASESRHDVEVWTAGVKAAMVLMCRWCGLRG